MKVHEVKTFSNKGFSAALPSHVEDRLRAKITRSLDTAEGRCRKDLVDTKKMSGISSRSSAQINDLLDKVCNQECTELVQEMRNTTEDIMRLYVSDQGTFSDLCSVIVVRKVEASLLGCCGNTCGWNGRTCELWPFMVPDDQEAWKNECCMEKNIIRFSEREAMCMSVLPNATAKKFREEDMEPEFTGFAEYLGESEELQWTESGAKSSIGRSGWAMPGEVVNDGFLRWQPLTLQEGLDLGWWKIQNRSRQPSPETRSRRSFLQVGTTETCSDFQLGGHCNEAFRHAFTEACVASEKWQYVEGAVTVATLEQSKSNEISPRKCEEEQSNHAWAVFKYDVSNTEKPVQCAGPEKLSHRTRPQKLADAHGLDFVKLTYVKALKEIEKAAT